MAHTVAKQDVALFNQMEMMMEASRVGSFDNEMYGKVMRNYCSICETPLNDFTNIPCDECLESRLLYENDMPTLDEAYQKYKENESRLAQKYVDVTRWKPNGITDNRNEWRSKNCEILAEIESEDPFLR